MLQESEVESVEFKWGMKRGRGGKKKDVQFYESFVYDNVEYQLYDSVYMYQESEPEPFIGKIIKIWELSDKTKKVKILWFFRPCEILNYLQDNITSENELFLASGNGVGLANINPLEAIAGKCNVVCISKDSRNPQPSKEELEEADFIFYRTFDVGHRVISEKIENEIAGVNVNLLFNKLSSQKPNAPEFHLDKKDTSEKALLTKETLGFSENKLGEFDTMVLDGDGISVKQSLGSTSSLVDHELSEMVTIDHTPESLFDGKSTSTFKGKGNAVAELKSSLEVRCAPDLGGQLGEESILGNPQKNIAVTINSRSKGKEILLSKPTLEESKSSHAKGNGPNASVELGKIMKNHVRESSSYENNTPKFEDHLVRGVDGAHKFSTNDVNIDGNLKTTKDFETMDSGLLKRKPLDGDEKVHDETTKKTISNLQPNSRRSEVKPDQISSSSRERFKRKLANNSYASENSTSKKSKVEVDLTREVECDARKSSNRTFEVTPRPEVEKKSKWFKRLPWKEWIPKAQEQGRLVLLQNLDPSYTSEEVQDIVYHAFGENCSAMPIQRTAISSPYSGQAFVIFRSSQVAEDAIRKLDEVCLLSNGRPLVGSIANLSFPGKQSTFIGHISMDKIKLHMQQEMKEAISTSHCSQPNNVEYDLAMDWCLLQERSELEWSKLNKRQERELKRLEGSLKSKRNEVSK